MYLPDGRLLRPHVAHVPHVDDFTRYTTPLPQQGEKETSRCDGIT
jgi:hypothetical protein